MHASCMHVGEIVSIYEHNKPSYSMLTISILGFKQGWCLQILVHIAMYITVISKTYIIASLVADKVAICSTLIFVLVPGCGLPIFSAFRDNAAVQQTWPTCSCIPTYHQEEYERSDSGKEKETKNEPSSLPPSTKIRCTLTLGKKKKKRRPLIPLYKVRHTEVCCSRSVG